MHQDLRVQWHFAAATTHTPSSVERVCLVESSLRLVVVLLCGVWKAAVSPAKCPFLKHIAFSVHSFQAWYPHQQNEINENPQHPSNEH